MTRLWMHVKVNIIVNVLVSIIVNIIVNLLNVFILINISLIHMMPYDQTLYTRQGCPRRHQRQHYCQCPQCLQPDDYFHNKYDQNFMIMLRTTEAEWTSRSTRTPELK